MNSRRVAVMQPYLFPYAGYFRLFAAADEFIVLDDVQFPRRGRVHRTEVPAPKGGSEWLTLPLARQRQSALICDLAFAPDARTRFDERLARHAWLRTAVGPGAQPVREFLHGPLTSVLDYIEAGLRLVAELTGVGAPLRRSSELEIDSGLRGEERIIALAGAVGATAYVNAYGGRSLYDGAAFRRAGMELSFLTPYDGPYVHLLRALVDEDPAAVAADIRARTSLVRA